VEATEEKSNRASAPTRFAFVHFSDIHLANYKGGATFDVGADLRRELVYDLEKVVESSGDLDGVLLGGDIAGTGKEEEYEQAAAWIDQLGEKFGIATEERVYCVPGNHDVDQAVIAEDPVLRALQDWLLTCRVDQFSRRLERLLAKGPHRGLAIAALEPYNKFAAHYGCGMLFEELRWIQVLELGPFRLQLVGLCSAVISGPSDSKDADLSALALGAQGMLGRFHDTFTLLLCHHPPSWLRDRTLIEPYLERAHLQLYGHEHTFDVASVGAGVRVDAGAVHPVWDQEGWHPSYNVIVLRVNSELDSTVDVDIYPRALQGDGKFGPLKPEEEMQRRSVSVALDATPPPAPPEPAQEPPQVSSDDERVLNFRFAELAPDRRIKIAAELGLLEGAEDDLPEGVQVRKIFERARDGGKLDALKEEMDD
jgi:predicted MPP superfamily phosphohydrolase